MNTLRKSGRTLVYLLALSTIYLGFSQAAMAGIVTTPTIVDAQQAQQDRAELRSLLARDDVRHELESFGVNPQQAAARVNSMTDSEVHTLVGKIGKVPAGGDVLGVAVFIFLVLLVTDILGYTDVFPFVKKTVR